MNQEKFNQIVKSLNEYKGIEEIFLLNQDGEILFKNYDFSSNTDEIKDLLSSWLNGKPSITYKDERYAILKNDEIQLAAKNMTGSRGNIAGSVTKEGDYLIIHIEPNTDLILLEWSILVNKVAWQN